MRAAISVLVMSSVLLGLAVAAASEARDELERLEAGDVPVRLHFPESRLGIVFDALGRVGGFEVSFEGEEPDEDVSIDWSELTVRDALSRLREAHGLRYRVPSAKVIVVVYAPADG